MKRKMFTHEERHFLLKLIHANKTVIENKDSDVANQMKKKMCWEQIAEMFNCQKSLENKRTASQLIKFWDNEKTKRKRILANAKFNQIPAHYPSYAEPNFSGVENADINVFLETSVDTGVNGLHNSYMNTEEDVKPFNFTGQNSPDIKPFSFDSHNGIDRELENDIDEMSVASSKVRAICDYETFRKSRQPPSENGDRPPSHPSASFSQSHPPGANSVDGSYEAKPASTSCAETDRRSKAQQELEDMRRQHEKEMNTLKLEEMKYKVELAKKELELREKHVELENKKIESLIEKEKFERVKEAMELDILRKKLE